MPTKIQHYVPRFYLKNFSSVHKNDKYYINCFDKSTKKQFNTNIENIGCEKYFYDTEEDVNQLIEKKLGQYENQFNGAYGKILKNENLKGLSTQEKECMTYFIASQLLRTKEERIKTEDLVKQIKKQLYNKAAAQLKKELDEAEKAESIRNGHIVSLIYHVPELAQIISKMKWVLFKNITTIPFWTSDNPITRNNELDFTPFGNLGLLNRGIEVHFPLSTELSLILLDPTEYGYFPNYDELCDEQNVIFENHLQVKFSTIHIFSSEDDFSLANKMLKGQPECGYINRKRWRVN